MVLVVDKLINCMKFLHSTRLTNIMLILSELTSLYLDDSSFMGSLRVSGERHAIHLLGNGLKLSFKDLQYLFP